MSLNEEKYKKEKLKLEADLKIRKKALKEFKLDLHKMKSLSPEEFQKQLIPVIDCVMTCLFDFIFQTQTSSIEIAKSFGTTEKQFSDCAKSFDVAFQEIERLKISTLINSLVVQEKLVLKRPISMAERRSIFSALNIDYDSLVEKR